MEQEDGQEYIYDILLTKNLKKKKIDLKEKLDEKAELFEVYKIV